MSSDAGTGIAIGAVGLLVTAGAIAGIVALARAASRAKRSGGTQVLAVLGIIVCLGFVLLGLAATGCGAILTAGR
jgi:hypothetical protein